MRTITKDTPIDSPPGVIGEIPTWTYHGLQVLSVINPRPELHIIHTHLEAIRLVKCVEIESALSMHAFLAFRAGRVIDLQEIILTRRLVAAAFELDEVAANLIIEDARERSQKYDLKTNLEELSDCTTMVKRAKRNNRTYTLVDQLYAAHHLTTCENPVTRQQIEAEFSDSGRAIGLGEIAVKLAIKKARSAYMARCEDVKFIHAQQERCAALMRHIGKQVE